MTISSFGGYRSRFKKKAAASMITAAPMTIHAFFDIVHSSSSEFLVDLTPCRNYDVPSGGFDFFLDYQHSVAGQTHAAALLPKRIEPKAQSYYPQFGCDL